MRREFSSCDQRVIHYSEVIMSTTASQITGVSIVCSTVCSGADQRKPPISASLAFVRGIRRLPMGSPHKGPVTRKMFPFDAVIIQKSWLPAKPGFIGNTEPADGLIPPGDKDTWSHSNDKIRVPYTCILPAKMQSLQWRHHERHGVSNPQQLSGLFN